MRYLNTSEQNDCARNDPGTGAQLKNFSVKNRGALAHRKDGRERVNLRYIDFARTYKIKWNCVCIICICTIPMYLGMVLISDKFHPGFLPRPWCMVDLAPATNSKWRTPKPSTLPSSSHHRPTSVRLVWANIISGMSANFVPSSKN